MLVSPRNPSDAQSGSGGAAFDDTACDFDVRAADVYALRCGVLGHWRVTRMNFEARLAVMVREDAELRRLRDAALAAEYPELMRLRERVKARKKLALNDDGAVTSAEAERLRFIEWLITQGGIGSDDRAPDTKSDANPDAVEVEAAVADASPQPQPQPHLQSNQQSTDQQNNS